MEVLVIYVSTRGIKIVSSTLGIVIFRFMVVQLYNTFLKGCCGCDCMVVGFTTTYANQCLSVSPLMLWVQLPLRVRSTTLCDKVCQLLVAGQWFSPGPPVSSTNKTGRHDITEIFLKVTSNTIKQTNNLYLLYNTFFVFIRLFLFSSEYNYFFYRTYILPL